MNTHVVQRGLLTALLLVYFLLPVTIPYLGVTPHGLILLCALVLCVWADFRSFTLRSYWPFLFFSAALAASWMWASHADVGAIRSMGFGLIAALLVSRYLSEGWGVRALQLLGWFVAGAAIVVTCLYLAATLGAVVTQFDPFTVFGVSSYHSGLFFLAGIPVVWFASVRANNPTPFLLMLPLWTALMISGLRGLWVGALAGVLIFGLASRRFVQTAAACGMAVMALGLTLVLTEHYLSELRKAERVASTVEAADPHPVSHAAFAPPDDLSPATVLAGSLAAKTRIDSGFSKFVEELTTSGRLGYWMAGMRMWSTSPVLGVGPGNFASRSEMFSVHPETRRDSEKRFDAHNMFVSVLAELGVVGFVALALLVWIPARRWLERWRQKPGERDSLALVAAVFVGLTVAGLTWDVHVQRIWWIGLGLMWASTLERSVEKRG